jgi:two-component system chemotaxis response regulator CheB
MNIVVIGGSAGSIQALRDIAKGLSRDMNSALFVVVHFPEDKVSYLPEILNSGQKAFHAVHAHNNSSIEKGRIYIAPPGLHMIVEKNKILLSDGPKENRFRPAIDVLFRSAAIAYGPQVTGIILSGALSDGTAGLSAIKKMGGIAVVQDPADATIDGMPLSALRYVNVDYKVPAEAIPSLLEDISHNISIKKIMKKDEIMEWENGIALGKSPDIEVLKSHADPTRYICPACDGPLFKVHDKNFPHYRCFVGHGFSLENLLKETNEKIEHLSWTVYRTLDEKKEMLRHFIEDKKILKEEEDNINAQLKVLKNLLKVNE